MKRERKHSNLKGGLFADKVDDKTLLQKLGLENREIFGVKFRSNYILPGKLFDAIIVDYYSHGPFTKKYHRLSAKVYQQREKMFNTQNIEEKTTLSEELGPLEKEVAKYERLQNHELPKIVTSKVKLRVLKTVDGISYCERLKPLKERKSKTRQNEIN